MTRPELCDRCKKSRYSSIGHRRTEGVEMGCVAVVRHGPFTGHYRQTLLYPRSRRGGEGQPLRTCRRQPAKRKGDIR